MRSCSKHCVFRFLVFFFHIVWIFILKLRDEFKNSSRLRCRCHSWHICLGEIYLFRPRCNILHQKQVFGDSKNLESSIYLIGAASNSLRPLEIGASCGPSDEGSGRERESVEFPRRRVFVFNNRQDFSEALRFGSAHFLCRILRVLFGLCWDLCRF